MTETDAITIEQLTTVEQIAIPEVVGGRGPRGREVEIQASSTHIQWRVADADVEWQDLVALADLRGADGDDGDDGKPIELRTSGGYIEWRVQDSATWTQLVALSTLKGDPGDPGAKGDRGPAVELRVDDGYVEWRVEGSDDEWQQLVALDDLRGEDGSTPTIEVGTVTTGEPGTDVIVTNVGTDTAVVLDITIPRGDKGADGTGGASTWDDISDKPTTFPPSGHSHTASDVTDLSDAVRTVLGAALVEGDNVTITVDDENHTITIAASGSGGGGTGETSWQDVFMMMGA